jgi:acetyl esterase
MLPATETNKGKQMPAPLDPVVEKIIPLLPLRDPTVMTPQSAREALRALAAARAAVPPPAVASAGRQR